MADPTNITTIQIQKSTWLTLNQMKESPSESFDDVILKLIECYKGAH